ncbi:hypothetical protein N7462_008714 [Penicillium macrosclerotiorum]|uniref:uncharacterized protein n=1 Tax=Penicillium macrosclerotiorum TaxID=303699 RepID=UPI002547933E|nr:uncharacterized protein N7462_008714 [Penicillium macrosclerotiorum]KAJ5675817.1 hypothetical protein N7462_008714 [Penicillium macrosclerotiorum]
MDGVLVDGSSPSSNGGNALVGVSVALSVMQIVFVAARFYTRYMQRTKCGADDYVMLVALFGSLSKAVIYIVLVEIAGLGYHIDEISHPKEKVALIRKGFIVLEILDFPLTITPAKISLLLFYLRIFYTRKFKVLAYLVGSLVLAIGITVLFESIFQCSPIGYGWNKSITHGSCIDQTVFYQYISPFNVLTGFLILAMPLPLVWRLHAPKMQRLAIIGVFMLGGLGTVASILRMVIYFMHIKTRLNDVTYFSVKLGILTVVEGAVLIIASCLVTIWPLVSRLCPNRLLRALCCHTSRVREHQCWYMTTREQTKTESALAPGQNIRRMGEGISWFDSVSSLRDIEQQRCYPSAERDEILVCERTAYI